MLEAAVVRPPPPALGPRDRSTWPHHVVTATAAPAPFHLMRKRSQSHNQMAGSPRPQDAAKGDLLSALKLEPVAPTTARRSSLSSTTTTARAEPHETTNGSLLQLPPPPLLLLRTRRGSLLLNATMRAMGHAPADPPSMRRDHAQKSNQDDDSDSDSDSDGDANANANAVDHRRADNNNNKLDEPTPLPPPPPPYFRLATFMLDDHDHDHDGRTPPTSPSSRSPGAGHASQLPPASKAAQIDAIFREIWSTEQSYVAALRGLVAQFFAPLQLFAKRHAIALGAMGALHHSTSTILSIHEELLRQLAPLQAGATIAPTASPSAREADPFSDTSGFGFTGTLARLDRLSRAFLATIEYMKVYAFYCGSYLAAKQELERLQRLYPKLAEFTAQLNETARRGSCSGQDEDADEQPPLDINSALIKPVQRICRYPLLFQKLRSNADGPEEALVLQQSLLKIEAVSAYVNEKVRESQNNARLYQLFEMLHPASGLELLQPGRTLLHEVWANVGSLDAPRWPAKLLRHFRRRCQRHQRRTSLQSPHLPREDWLQLSVLGDDRRSSATVTAQLLRASGGSSGGGTIGQSSNRHTSFSTASTTTTTTTTTQGLTSPTRPPPPSRLLQRRRSSGGERSRLILLSDMLLMGKLKDHRLKIRRQICLSCAVIHDDDDDSVVTVHPPPRPLPLSPTTESNHDDMEQDLLPPLPAPGASTVPAAATTAARDVAPASCAFTLEVAKVDRCSCRHFSPLTLKRSTKLSSLSALLGGRRSSVSLAASAGDLLQALDQIHDHDHHDHNHYPADGGDAQRQLQLQRSPSSLHRLSSRMSRSCSRFRYLEQLAGLRSVKRYRVTCDSLQDKAAFLQTLRQAIARSARLVSLGGASGSASGSTTELAAPREPSAGAKAVAMAVSFPVKIWRSIRSASEQAAPPAESTSPPHVNLRTVRASTCSSYSLAAERSGREADLLHLDDTTACLVATSLALGMNAA